MSTEDTEPKPKTSIEDRIKSNVALWFLGALATGFSAGIGAVKWSDERYKVEPIPLAEKDAFVKAQSDLIALQKAYKDLEVKNTELKAVLSKQTLSGASQNNRTAGQPVAPYCTQPGSELASIKDAYAKSQVDLAAALKSCGGAPASGSGVRKSELAQIAIIINYARKRYTDANLITNRLGADFREVQLVVCTIQCTRTAQINYGYDLSATIAFSVARLLTQAGIGEFAQPMITQGEGPHRITVYLSD
jgi:hypothetical protein